VTTVPVNTDRGRLFEMLKRTPYSRLPVYEGGVENVIGYINIFECLTREESFEDLRGFVAPLRRVDANTTVIDAINLMQKEKEKILLVSRASYTGRARPVGIVTMKDLAEELVGELAEW
jgi:CBS domain containing-hemolysin-like protein